MVGESLQRRSHAINCVKLDIYINYFMRNINQDHKLLRYETKVPMQQQQYWALVSSLSHLGLRSERAYADRMVHSIYFDSCEYDDYHDNVSGISSRSKTRIRWYDADTIQIAIETKRKRNKVSEKEVIRLENISGEIPRDSYSARAFIEPHLDSNISIRMLNSVFPTLEVEYKRSYYHLAPKIRMTVDRKMRFRKLYPIISDYWRHSPVDFVVEFKYPVGLEKEFGDLMRDMPNRIFRHSKYVIGMDSVCVG